MTSGGSSRRGTERPTNLPSVDAGIGYGAGHYDYTFAHLRRTKAVRGVGIAFAAQQIKAVPALAHDVALDYVLTETDAFDFRSS